MADRVVIVGASLGALRTAESLRRAKYVGDIVIIGDEPHLPYSRPPLSKEVLAAEVMHDVVAFPLRAAVADVDWRLGRTVTAADLDKQSVALADGEQIEYDGLVVATGLRPRRLDLPGPGPSARRGSTRGPYARRRRRVAPGAGARSTGRRPGRGLHRL